MNVNSPQFITALQNHDINGLKRIPKAEYHSHAGLGYKLWRLEEFYKTKIQSPPASMNAIDEMGSYIRNILRPYYGNATQFENALSFTLQEAREDGLTHLEASVDIFFSSFYPSTETFCEAIRMVSERVPDLVFLPEIGITRTMPLDLINKLAIPLIESGFFRSIDLYDDELAVSTKEFIPLYREAERHGLTRKVHAGEFGSAEAVREAAEQLNATEIQHGIAAASSPEIMNWLRDNQIQLNICPTSNIALKRVESLKVHPAKNLYDYGVKITINTDDILFFNQTLSEEYLNLYRAGLFSAPELDQIRISALPINA